MRIRICAVFFVLGITSLPLLGAPQQSLGDLARQLRQKQPEAGRKATRVYTNDNLPTHSPEEKPAAPPGTSSTPPTTSSDKAQPEPDSSHEAGEISKAPETGQAANEPAKPEKEKESKEYWQGRFKSARARLADAQERQQLAEDELNLLQIQQVRQVDASAKAEFDDKVKAKQDEVSDKRAATREAQRALDDLQDEFKASGAPEEWSETED
jgi:hypothetical protein